MRTKIIDKGDALHINSNTNLWRQVTVIQEKIIYAFIAETIFILLSYKLINVIS